MKPNYYYLSNQIGKDKTETQTTLTETDLILQKDFTNDYPKTPREVVKWYNRIIKEYYAEKHTKKETNALIKQQRALLDKDLLAANPKATFYKNVKANIKDYAKRDEKIIIVKTCSSSDITYAKVKGYNCAYATSYYFSREGNDYSRTFQEFCLRQDDNGNWKILTWKLTEGDPDDYK